MKLKIYLFFFTQLLKQTSSPFYSDKITEGGVDSGVSKVLLQHFPQ